MRDAKNYTVIGVLVIIALMAASYLYKQVFSIPPDFPVAKSFIINENESLKSISNRLKQEKYISSPLLFRAGISYLGKDRNIQLGGYVFNTPLSLFGVVATFVEGKPTAPLLSVTIPEGSTSFEIANIVAKRLPGVSVDLFGEMISKYNADGKLFPSTYFLLPSYSAEDIVKLMVGTFAKKVATLSVVSTISPPLKSEQEVLVLASILEGEAKSQADMKVVAGILLSRLELGMPLQVDVAMETYKKKGLPATPINNPGLTAIDAVLHPTVTPYLFYITGDDGNMYYAKTFEEHKKNIRKYLK
jgi:UPF0755 protein